MQLHLSFATLLAGVLLALSTAQDSAAAPIAKRKAGLVTLPLTRVKARDDVHPSIYLQQHINRGNRRLARMTGREEPTDLELRAALEKRILATGDETLAKRYLRFTPSKGSRDVEDDVTKRFNRWTPPGTREEHDLEKRHGRGHGHGQNAGAGAGGGVGAGAGVAGASDDGTDVVATETVVTATGTGAAATETGAADDTNDSAGSTAQDGVTPANDPTAANSLGLDVEGNDVGYFATVQMGTPPTDFKILMDSGSADLWVGSEQCVSDQGGDCGNHQFLGSQSSSTFQASNQPFSITYGTGSVSGVLVQDTVSVAGIDLADHTFGVATVESVEFSSDDTSFDGLMGLAQSTLSNQQVLTPPESMAQQGLIPEAIVSYKISRLADNLNDGEITFGGLDDSKFDPATLTTLDNVNQNGFWEADMDAVTVDGQDTGLTGKTAILDTGTTLIVAPAADALAVHQLIDGAQSDGQGGFIVPCDTTASVAMTFGGASFTIDPRDIAFFPLGDGTCISGISSGNIGGADEWLVGDVFLKNAYFSTDVGKNTLSLAKLV